MPSEKRNLLLAALLLAAASALFMTLNARGMWDFVLPLRAAKLLAILLVAYAIGVSTLLFQTLTHNPILTPSLLGFDTLYVFLQTLLVLVLGGIGYVQLNPVWKFSGEMLVMLGGSMLLFQVLLRQGGRDLARSETWCSWSNDISLPMRVRRCSPLAARADFPSCGQARISAVRQRTVLSSPKIPSV